MDFDSDEKLFGNAVEFAKHRGISQGYVSQLKKRGYLVLTNDGLIDFKASDRRLTALIDLNRAVGQKFRKQLPADALAHTPASSGSIGRVLSASFDRSLVPAASLVAKHLGVSAHQALEVMEIAILALWSAADIELDDEIEIPAGGTFAALMTDRPGVVRVVEHMMTVPGTVRAEG